MLVLSFFNLQCKHNMKILPSRCYWVDRFFGWRELWLAIKNLTGQRDKGSVDGRTGYWLKRVLARNKKTHRAR